MHAAVHVFQSMFGRLDQNSEPLFARASDFVPDDTNEGRSL